MSDGFLTKSERCSNAEQALKSSPNINQVIGHSLGGSVASYFQNNYQGLQSRAYGALVLDFKRTWDDTYA